MKISILPLKPISSRWKAVIAFLGVGVYIVLFFPLYEIFGPSAGAMAIFPTAAISWLYGTKRGLIASILFFPVNTLLYNLAGVSGWNAIFQHGGGPGSMALVLCALIIGHLSYTRSRLSKELHERQQIETALRQSEMLARSVIQTVANIIIYLAADHTILEWNKQAEEVYGWRREEVIGQNYLHLFVGQNIQQEMSDNIRHVIENKQVMFGLDNMIRRRDGSKRLITWNVAPMMDADQNAIGIIASGQDVTDFRAMEKAQMELAIERERVESTRQFVSDLSHDLKTPLAVINTSLYLLSKIEDPVRQQLKLNDIRVQTRHLEKLIEDILLISQLDNLPELHYDLVDVHQIIDEILTRFRSEIEVKNLGVSLSLDMNLPQMWGDADEINRLLTNLIENAVRYTPKEGRIHIETGKDENNIRFRITDTGIGIHKNDIPHIFDRFYRADSARSSEKGGTGLGLAIVKSIVSRHQGEIQVESSVGQGCTFTVRLPLKMAPPVS